MSFVIENGVLEEYIPSGETDIVIPEGVTCIGNRVFEFCRCLRSIKIPDGVTSIGIHAFSHCKDLRSITIPESVTSIGDFAFDRCGLRSITIPDSVTHIGYSAFTNVKITFSSKKFQISFLLKGWGLIGDDVNLPKFYNDPTADNFKKIRLTRYKYPMALLRFFGHNEDEYGDYIKRNIAKIALSFADEKNYALINMILAAGFITKSSMDKLINHSVKVKQTDMTALLLDHKNKHFGFTDINKRFRL